MYGRTKGRKLSCKQKYFLKNHFGQIALTQDSIENFFSRLDEFKVQRKEREKLILEIGFGSAEHLAFVAEREPYSQFIGCDYYLNGVASAAVKITEMGLKNVRIFHGDAKHFLQSSPDGCLDEVYLPYPDPWPKSRHYKRRFISYTNLELLSSKLIKNGLVKIATDSKLYFDHVRLILSHERISKIFDFENTDFLTPWVGWKQTKYEEKAKKAGRTSFYMILKNSKVK